jgi:hypothetical protein
MRILNANLKLKHHQDFYLILMISQEKSRTNFSSFLLIAAKTTILQWKLTERLMKQYLVIKGILFRIIRIF